VKKFDKTQSSHENEDEVHQKITHSVKNNSKHRIMHEFEILFHEELDMHMNNVYEVALDIFAEA